MAPFGRRTTEPENTAVPWRLFRFSGDVFQIIRQGSNGTFTSSFSHALTGRETSRVTCIHYGNVIFQLALTHAQWGRQGVNFMRQWFSGRVFLFAGNER